MAPKGNVRRVTGNRDVATRFIESRGNFKIVLQLLENMVAREGAEAPTPAFSGPILTVIAILRGASRRCKLLIVTAGKANCR
jgi:hypothetical protein